MEKCEGALCAHRVKAHLSGLRAVQARIPLCASRPHMHPAQGGPPSAPASITAAATVRVLHYGLHYGRCDPTPIRRFSSKFELYNSRL